jgi:hypothetical protein
VIPGGILGLKSLQEKPTEYHSKKKHIGTKRNPEGKALDFATFFG